MQKTLQIQRFHAECCKTQVLGPYHVGGGGGGVVANREPGSYNFFKKKKKKNDDIERYIYIYYFRYNNKIR